MRLPPNRRMVGVKPSHHTPVDPPDKRAELDARLEADGNVKNDPRWFKKDTGLHQPLTMNTVSGLPLCALEKIVSCLTKAGYDELMYRRWLKDHPGMLPN